MRLITIICLSCLQCAMLCAQNTIREDAFDRYDKGRFAEAENILKEDLPRLSGQELVAAYRLLALSAFYQDHFEDTELWAQKLLSIDPYFKAYGDDPRFQDILERMRTGGATVSTASKQRESIEEAPVPMTLITEEMIRISGCRTVRELLCLFVPGMTRVDNMEPNVAMRGLYGNSQENILVMQDGHRLNSGVSNAEPMDQAIAVDKIDHIEVLRGPASSLYGNMALSGVVNIFTKSGATLSGSSLNVRGGMFGTIGATYMYGQGDLLKDLSLWASFGNSTGERINDNGTTHYVGGYNNMPSFDLGLKTRWNDFQVAVTVNHSKPVSRYMMINFDSPFSYDKYSENDSEKPGFSRFNINMDLDYSHSWGNFTLFANGYAHYEQRQVYNAMGDSIPFGLAFLMEKSMGLDGYSVTTLNDVKTRGVWQTLAYKDITFGLNINGAWNYGKENRQHGTVMAGIQYEHFMLLYSRLQLGYDFDKIQHAQNDIVERGRDRTISGTVQLKHYFIPNKLVFNGGLRFDNKVRFDGAHNNTFSPRAAIIYMPSAKWSTRLSYSRAYVDAPYLYRASNFIIFSGGKNLQSQTIDAFSMSGTWTRHDLGLRLELNLFYNRSMNQVVYSPTEILSNGGSPFYNAGHVDIGGVEFTGEWRHKGSTYINLNATYQYAFTLEHYGVSGKHRVGNIPEFLLNLTAGQRVINSPRWGELWLRANAHFVTSMPMVQNRLSSMIPKGMFTMNAKDYLSGIASLDKISTDFPDENIRNTALYIKQRLYETRAKDLANSLSAETLAKMKLFVQTIKTYMPEDGEKVEMMLGSLIGERASQASIYENGPQVIINAGADWRFKYHPSKHDKKITLSVDVYNVTNANYKYGSLLNSYIPSQSISVMGKASVEF